MKALLLAIVIELVGVNFGLIGIVLGASTYRNISRWAAILGVILALCGLIPKRK